VAFAKLCVIWVAFVFWVFYSPPPNAKTSHSSLKFPAANNCSHLITFLLSTYSSLIRVLICWPIRRAWCFVICVWLVISGGGRLFCCVGWFIRLLVWVRVWLWAAMGIGWGGDSFSRLNAGFNWPSMLCGMLPVLSGPSSPITFGFLAICFPSVSIHSQSPPLTHLLLSETLTRQDYHQGICFGPIHTGQFKPANARQSLGRSTWYSPGIAFSCPQTSFYCPDWAWYSRGIVFSCPQASFYCPDWASW
jgi:hypothetical protein